MKKLFSFIITFVSVLTLCHAQQTSQPIGSILSPTLYTVVLRGANSRAWESMSYQVSASGQIIPRVHQYTELATGLCFQQNGQWADSVEQISILPDGSAAATNGQHQAYFPSDVYDGVIKLVTPDGLQLQSQPIGLSYDDGTNTVLIAELTNSVGELISSNEVLYPNAFVGIDADLLYTYTKAGFEQDVLLRQQPPSPENFSMDSQTTTLQMMTEFVDPPEPSIKTHKLPAQQGMALDNDSLNFGTMNMKTGRAFLPGAKGDKVHAVVAKKWVNVSGRQILVEEVPVMTLANAISNLPQPASTQVSQRGSSVSVMDVVSANRLLPAKHLAGQGTRRQRHRHWRICLQQF